MEKWEIFEEESTKYLNENYGDLLKYKKMGSSNSNVPDIIAYYKGEKVFSIEAKLSIAQSGQIVVFSENGKLRLSDKSVKNINNDYTYKIIEYFNNNNLNLPKAQKGITLNIPLNIGFGWLKEHYRANNSEFIITSDRLNDYKALIDIKNIEQYFKFECVMRRKRSGSRHIARKKSDESINILKKYLDEIGNEIKEVSKINGKTYVRLSNEVNKRKDRYFGERLYLSPIKNCEHQYFIKQTSDTNNLNIMFEIEYIGPKQFIGGDLFKDFIRRLNL